jgi:hypothetical protein
MADGQHGKSMKILLVDPNDSADEGPWARERWDRIVDLGLAGQQTYESWSNRFQCPVTTLSSLQSGFDNSRRVRRLMDLGCGRLVDQYGLDWWEIMAMLLSGELETLLLLRQFRETIGPSDDVHVSRNGSHARLLKCLLKERVKIYAPPHGACRTRLAHYAEVFQKLSASQLVDIICDKYDAGYRFRSRLTRKRKTSRTPVVLIPTAYVNVSRTGVAYANTFVHENFLLVSTRRSGWMRGLPPNVEAAWLSQYASQPDRNAENKSALRQWQLLLKDLRSTAEFETLHCQGSLDSFPRWLERGFQVREAWLNVFDTEQIQGVLCSDDSNPYTRIPLLLAHGRGLPNIACHHGALDSGYLFKRTHGDVIWAKGRMEKDYLVRHCGVPSEKVEICAPSVPNQPRALVEARQSNVHGHVLFLSEAHEHAGGRAQEFYRDVLPPLAELALFHGRKLVVKLHPTESKFERAKMIWAILSDQQKTVTSIVSGPLTEDLLSNTWFAITILSTVAMECAMRGIPCFLCKWLEYWKYGYVDQFVRFEVGIGLNNREEINRIPEYLANYAASASVRENCWQPARPERLHEMLTSAEGSALAMAAG